MFQHRGHVIEHLKAAKQNLLTKFLGHFPRVPYTFVASFNMSVDGFFVASKTGRTVFHRTGSSPHSWLGMSFTEMAAHFSLLGRNVVAAWAKHGLVVCFSMFPEHKLVSTNSALSGSQ